MTHIYVRGFRGRTSIVSEDCRVLSIEYEMNEATIDFVSGCIGG